MANPTILVPIPTSFDEPYNQQCWPEYAQAVEASGAQAQAVPLDATDAQISGLIAKASGILLPGSGADVAPDRYGHAAEPETATADPSRERVDRLLLEAVHTTRMPLLAICFGLQSLNVFRGGTLVQHLQPVPVNHRAGRAVADAHGSIVAADSRLGGILEAQQGVAPAGQDGFLRLMINSSHHQAVGAPGAGLRVTARSTEDAVIEAVEDESFPFLLGVQWHPERTLQHSAASRAILQAFANATRNHVEA